MMAGLTDNEALIVEDGLVINSYSGEDVPGLYIGRSSGTAEGQFLLIQGMLEAFQKTGDTRQLEMAERALAALLSVVYRNVAVPDAVTTSNPFSPHWLFAARYPFDSSVIEYEAQVAFTNGVGVIPLDTVRHVFHARSMDSAYLWESPYSSLTAGTLYAVKSYAYTAGTGMTVTLDQAFTGTLKVTFANQVGTEIEVGDPYAITPDWRLLDATEIETACNTYILAYRAFTLAYQVTGTDTWNDAARATKEQAALAIDLADGRDWLKPTWAGSPYADGNRFASSSRSPAPSFGVDQYGRTQIDIPQYSSGDMAISFGKSPVNDVYASGDTTTVTIESNTEVTATLYIDRYQAYSADNRYSVSMALTGSGSQTFTFALSDFKNASGASMPADSPVYAAGISASPTSSATIWVERVRQSPQKNATYYLGAIPMYAEFMGAPLKLVTWRGPVYIGYQSPDLWLKTGQPDPALTSVQLLVAAQDAWVSQTGGTRGPFVPVFYPNRDDTVDYGTVNTFGWTGPDNNTEWGGYQYRPLSELAIALSGASSGSSLYNLSLQSLNDFISWLKQDINWIPVGPEGATKWADMIRQAAIYPSGEEDAITFNAVWPEDRWTYMIRKSAALDYATKADAEEDANWPAYSWSYFVNRDQLIGFPSTDWPDVPMGPPTNFPSSGRRVDYPDPYMAALLMKAVLVKDAVVRPSGDSSGTMSTADAIVLDKCIMLLDSLWVESGTMAGTFSPDPDNHEWYGFWHGEIMSSVAALWTWSARSNTNITADMSPLLERSKKWLAGMTKWADENDEGNTSAWGDSLWPFAPDWASGVSETFEYSTNIITSFTGEEQRIARRDWPLRTMTLRHTLVSQSDAASYRAIIQARQNRPMLVPQWHLSVSPSVDVAAGANIIPLTSVPDYWRTGDALYIYARNNAQLTTISGINADSVETAVALKFSVPMGSRIMTAYQGLINTDLSATLASASYLQSENAFTMLPQEDGRVLPDKDDERWVAAISGIGHLWADYIRRAAMLTAQPPLSWPTLAADQQSLRTFTVNGDTREIITRKPNWISAVSLQDTWVYDVISYNNGPVTPAQGEAAGRRTMQAQWTMFNEADRDDVLSMLKRLRGMQTACWIPSWARDLEMTQDMTSLNKLYVKNNSIIDEGLLRLATVGICINTKLNSFICARASSYTTGNNEIVITLDRDLPWRVSMEEVAKISLLYRVRQATDKADITWLTQELGQVQVAFVTIQE